ncbi:FAD-binding oxidoreductase [Actinomadura craniellae]|uniref:FAD-binding oxidoreductase n=1 Tax=Actinomadura craniellae TaxID=2231787 RepID=A0A365H1G8_9ACTN|nr:FAD-dependent oxidoreductase [Actinomadura craniellae]RAY12944.1 FAD-binding oxidoreductase [Actinomadura craniellae]
MTHVLIVGAGIIGTALADRLAPHARVTVIDAHLPGQGTTATSLAWLNANKTIDPGYFAFRIEALRAWSRLAIEFGDPPWYVPTGNLTWAQTEEAVAELSARVERLQARRYPARFLTHDQAHSIEPGLVMPADALIAHFPGEGFVHGAQAAHALMGRAQASGARLRTGDRVVHIVGDGGQVRGAHLASGDTVAADITICAAGWRTPDVLATANTGVPLLDAKEPGSAAPCLVATTTPIPKALRGIVHAPGIYARPAWDGGLLLEAGDLDAITDMNTPQADLDTSAADLLTRAREIIPALSQAQISHARRCIRPMPTDGFPLIGWRQEGLYVAVTHSGITLAAHLAELITREILHGTRPDELAPYRPDRTAKLP